MIKRNRSVLYRALTWLIALGILLTGCSAPQPTPTQVVEAPTAAPTEAVDLLEPISQEELTTGVWQWLGGKESPSAPKNMTPDPEKYTITFNPDGKLFIQADCNTVRGTYQLSGNELSIELGASTLVACEPGSFADQYLTQLSQAERAGSGYGNLVIALADEGEMYFQPGPATSVSIDLEPITQEELIDTLWQWTNLVETAPASEIGVGQPENYTLVFRADGSYSAKADCNQLAGAYELQGAQLTLNPGLTTLAMCEPDSNYDLYQSLLWRVTGVGQREGLLVLLLDDGAATMSFVNAGEAEAVPAQPVSPATVQGDPAAFLGAPDGVENFNNSSNWTEFDNTCFTTQITGGQFVMTANGLPGNVCWEVSWPQLDNFYVETTLQMPQTCNPQDRFGLLFRAPDLNRGYLYGFTCAGEYTLTIWDGATTTVLAPPTRSTAILTTPRAVNRMGLLAFGEDISLYANGVFLQTVTDFTYLDAGRFGYFVRAATENPFTVRYDQLRVWTLEDEFFPPEVSNPFPEVDLPMPPSNTPTGEARVNSNVRSGPSMLFPVIGSARQGDTGQVLGISPDGFWYAVSVPTNRVGTGIGWISADLINLTNPTGQPLATITPPLLPTLVTFPAPAGAIPQVSMREPATLRSGPTLEFPVMGVAPTGSRAEVIGESQDREWWAVRVGTNLASNGTAWVPKVFAFGTNIGNVPVLPTPDLPRNITPAAPASGAPSLVTQDTLNVRSGPGNDFPSLGRVSRGTILAVVGVSPDREFFVVNVPTEISRSGQGWLPARWVRADNVGNVPVIQPPPVP